MLIAGAVSVSLLLGSLASGAVWADMRSSARGRGGNEAAFVPQVWSTPLGSSREALSWSSGRCPTLVQGCSEGLSAGWQVCFDILASEVVPRPFPLPQVILKNVAGVSWQSPNCQWSAHILEIGGEGVWIVPLQKHSAQDFSKPTWNSLPFQVNKNKFTS